MQINFSIILIQELICLSYENVKDPNFILVGNLIGYSKTCEEQIQSSF
jgi:hypothetical protein